MRANSLRIPKVWYCEECLSNSGASHHQSYNTNAMYPVITRKELANKCRYRSLSTINGVPNKANKSVGEVIMTRKDATDVKESTMQKDKVSASDASRLHDDGQKRGTSKGGIECCATLCHTSVAKVNDLPLTLLMSPSENFPNVTARELCWRGNFEVFDVVNHLYDGIEAHFALQVSHKAYEISKKLPGKLKLDMVPRKNSWSNKFQSDPPTYKDIGLYFFPSQYERERDKYFRLLKRIDSRDLSLKAWIGDVALLIYSSKQLSVDCHQIDGQIYLWGMFWHLKRRQEHNRRRQDIIHSTAITELKSNACDQSIVNFKGYNQEVDMEIDMIGGKEIGPPDKPIRNRGALSLCRPVVRQSSDSDVPPGFSRSNIKLASVFPIVSKIQFDPRISDRLLCRKISSVPSDVPPDFGRTSNTNQASESPNLDKIQSAPETRDVPPRSNPPQKLAAVLPLFPQEAESMNVKEISDDNTREMISLDLSLSRPDYLMDGNVYISPTPRVTFDQDGCQEVLQLKL